MECGSPASMLIQNTNLKLTSEGGAGKIGRVEKEFLSFALICLSLPSLSSPLPVYPSMHAAHRRRVVQ